MTDRVLISTRKGLFELTRGAAGWRLAASHFLGEPVTVALRDQRDGTTYAALNLGHFGVKLHRKDAGADSWTEIAAPAYPPKPEGSEDKVEWTLKQVWVMEAGGADQPGVIYAGTIPGGLFVSRDRGESWELVRSLWDMPQRAEFFGGGYDAPGIHSICVDPRNSRHVLLAISCGGVWRTEDGGESWSLSAKGMSATYMPPELAGKEEVQDPHRMVRCAGAPDVLWCQHHNGIWRSEDNAHTWVEVKNAPVSNFGFAVAVHPNDPNTAWFAPAEADMRRIPVHASMSVTRTRDSAHTFDVLRNGLPQEHCYDLVYRHGLAVAGDGKTLVMASTTGSVWISEDGGDHWQNPAPNMPPVYAVTFA
jgi:hypothetical protein